MWELYDAMIEAIPEDMVVDEVICGTYFSYVRSGEGAGIARSALDFDTRMPIYTKKLMGAPLKEVAACIKSWNLLEASIGGAAINAYYNNPWVAKKNGVEYVEGKHVEDRMHDPFIMAQNEVRGKKVTIIGHFPYIDKLLEPICDLSILEWQPEEGEFPMTACEYLLPESDYVYISATSVVDKTLPRYLELSKNAKRVTLVGPGTPLDPSLFSYGIHDLSGFLITDTQHASLIIAGAERVKLSCAGQKTSLKGGG
ncbi:MAG: Rossmann-like domain-containing protein [Velocimicrobium sp.]